MKAVASLVSPWMRVRRVWDRLVVYLPLLLMGLMAMATYWLVRNTPVVADVGVAPAPQHVPDYVMRDFSLKVFGEDGQLKSEMVGLEGRHFPDTDTLEIEQPRIRILGAQARVTTAVATRALINADGSEVQLFGKARVTREASTNAKGAFVPRSELQSDFLHLFANTEQVRSHLSVTLMRGTGDNFTADGMDFDNLDRVMALKGRVHGTLLPPKEKK